MKRSSSVLFSLRASTAMLAFSSLSIHAGVYSHYSFDTDYSDSSGNDRHGALADLGTSGNSGIITTAGNFKFGGGAVDFADEADYVVLPSKTFSSGVAYTISFWAQLDSTSNQWNMAIGDQSNNFFIALQNNNTLRWRSSSSNSDRQQDFAATTDTAWHHYAIVASGTTVTCYRDGSLVSTGTGKSTGFTIDGIGSAYGAANGFDFRGRIDEVWILDEAADANTITNLYTNNTPAGPLPTELLHHRYDSDLTDSSTAANDGTAVGDAAVISDPEANGGGSLGLDGSGDYVTLDSAITFSATDAWTTTWWARRGETGSQNGMVMGKGSNNSDFIWLNDNFNGLRFRSSNATTHDFTVAKDTLLHHYALVADGAGNISLYRDGDWVQDKTGNTAFVIDTIGKAYDSTAYMFNGSLDEVRIFDDALDATQIDQIYASEKPVEVPNPSVTRLRIILLGGQSNGDGRAATSGLPTSPVNLQNPQDDVDFFYRVQYGSATLTTLRPGLSETSNFGPEITLGRKMADLWAGETNTRVAIIKYANGGTNLHTQWKGGGDNTTSGDGSEYVTFQQAVAAGLATLAVAYPNATLDLQGMVWMQGESDNNLAANASAYETNLTNFIADVRLTYGANLPFVIGEIAVNGGNSNTATIRAAQAAVAATDSYTGFVDVDTFGMQDSLHFSPAGQMSLGSGFATETAYYEWMIDTFSAADINAGKAEPDADADTDGKSNRDEFLGTSDPLDATSAFKAWITLPTETTAEIHYDSSVFRRYAVEQWNVSTEIWEEILAFEAGDGGVKSRQLTLDSYPHILRIRSDMP